MTNSFTWNGPICPTCHTMYLGSHQCSREDIQRRIGELVDLLGTLPLPARPRTSLDLDPTRSCPCRPENGGSGICGCTLGGPQVTC
jgi:hypothetical protein